MRRRWRRFFNVIENAIRYVKTKIRIFLKEDGANYIIVFENDGKPIEQKTMEMLFDKFYKGPKGSFGLGLYIARKIAIFHARRYLRPPTWKTGCSSMSR